MATPPTAGEMREPAPRPLRAGDSDRAAVVELLHAHHLEGRLTVEEFEERVGRAQRAVTLIELGDLHSDLPERSTSVVAHRGAESSSRRRAPRVPGSFSFVERVELDVAPAVARDRAFQFIAPALARSGYELSVVGGALMFRRRWRPTWTILVAIFTFPIGLIALAYKHTDEVILEINPGPSGGTEIIAHGVGPLVVRRAFAMLRD